MICDLTKTKPEIAACQPVRDDFDKNPESLEFFIDFSPSFYNLEFGQPKTWKLVEIADVTNWNDPCLPGCSLTTGTYNGPSSLGVVWFDNHT